MRLPKPIRYTAQEGGNWIEWGKQRNTAPAVAHTIVFNNGRALDMLNGWRDGGKFKYDKKTGERL